MEKLGILAGAGKLPVECARAAANLGYEVYAVGLLPNSDTQIAQFAKDFQFISVAQLEAILNYLKNNSQKLMDSKKLEVSIFQLFLSFIIRIYTTTIILVIKVILLYEFISTYLTIIFFEV